MVSLFGLKLGIIAGGLAFLGILWAKFRNMFLDHQIQVDENKEAQTNFAIATQSEKINQDEEKLNEAMDNYNKSKESTDSGEKQ